MRVVILNLIVNCLDSFKLKYLMIFREKISSNPLSVIRGWNFIDVIQSLLTFPAWRMCSPHRARESTKVKSNNSRDRLPHVSLVRRPSHEAHIFFSPSFCFSFHREIKTLAGTVAALGTAASEDMPHFASHLTFVRARAPWTMNSFAGYPLWIPPR